jgi:DNA-binding GntR family transcriptional regulator
MTKKDLAYRQLRASLLGGMLLPGTRLREIPLARQLGVSRIPLREAMDQLANEGLVERLPGLGSYVRSMTAEELRQMYEMREVLEGYTVEKACRSMTGEQLGRMEDLYREISDALGEFRRTGRWTSGLRERLVRADVTFHQTIASAAGNEPIRKEIGRLQSVAEVVSYRPEIAPDETKAMTRSAADHLGILRALRARDGVEARRLMAKHLRYAADRALLMVQSALQAAQRASRAERRPGSSQGRVETSSGGSGK